MGTVASLFHSSPVLWRLIYKPQGTWSELCAIKIFSRQKKERLLHFFFVFQASSFIHAVGAVKVCMCKEDTWQCMGLCACVQSFLVCHLPMNKLVSPSIYVLRLNPEKLRKALEIHCYIFRNSQWKCQCFRWKNSREWSNSKELKLFIISMQKRMQMKKKKKKSSMRAMALIWQGLFSQV